jgi:4-aminobutyrate aminotransferase-like enzyme
MPAMHMVNSYDPSQPAGLSAAATDLLTRRERVLGAPYRLFYRHPVEVSRAEGVLLYDSDGNDYLDAYNNVPVVGHSNPRVQQAVSEQLGVLNTHTRYLTEPILGYAERLLGLFPEPLSQVIFACTGSEAVDLALRIARHATGAEGIIVTRHAYHGTTRAAAEISPSLGPNNPIPPTVALVDAPDAVRDDQATAARKFAGQIAEAISAFATQGIQFAGLIIDSVLSSDGLQPGAALATAIDVVHASGGLFIADEVQAGFGRTGSRWWGFQRHGIAPDLVVLGKPMGNGLPISAVVGTPELFGPFGRDVRYFNTFGGSPVCIAAAGAVLDELGGRDLLARAVNVGQYLRDELAAIAADDEGVAQVRGAGLFLAVELVRDGTIPDPERAARLVNAMRERRVLISASGTYDNVLKIRPPLVFGREHATRLLEAFAASLPR